MRQLLIDTSLLVLLIVGLKDRVLITKHKRTQTFSEDDFMLLQSIIKNYDCILVTPNTLTECSNLLRQIGDPVCRELTILLKKLIEQDAFDERFMPSKNVVRTQDFPKLGLTDAGILEVVSRDLPLLTVDLKLYLAALRKDAEAALNFNHLRGKSYK